jgi:hypothetical protein
MFLYEELNRQRSQVSGMLIRQVELPVSDAVQAARFYGDVLDLPTRTGGGVVQVEVGPSVLLLHPGPVEPGAYHAAITVPKDRFAEAKVWLQKRVSLLERDRLDEFALGGAVELPVPLLRRAGWDFARTDRPTRPGGGPVRPIHQRRLVADQ